LATTLTVTSPGVRAAAPAAPAATRDFPAGDTLSVYAEIYDNRSKDPHRLDLVAELRTLDGRLAGRSVTETRNDNQGVQKLDVAIPLDVAPGAYVLHVEARSTLAKQPAASREIPLRVR